MKKIKLLTILLLAAVLFAAGAVHGKSQVKQKLKGSDKKEQPEPKTSVIDPAAVSPKKDQLPTEIKLLEPRQSEVLSASAAKDKGRQIKWQLVCAGSGCGNDNVAFTSRYQDFHYLCGTLGQVAVGRGSSPSFGMNQGFWQETITTEYVRGDVNGDGIINVGDIVYLVSYLYKGGPPPDPAWIGDCNCDEIVNVGDIVFLVSYLYKGGPEPVC